MKKGRLSLISTLVVSAVVIIACQEKFPFDGAHTADSAERTEKIEEARAWYDKYKPDKVTVTKSMDTDSLRIRMAPNWKQVYLRENSRYRTVEVSAITGKRVTAMTPEVRSRYYATENRRYNQDMRRFVFRTDKKTGVTEGFIMNIVPSLEFMEKKESELFRRLTYTERDEEFTGYILYYELDGSFANGWKYEDGAVTHAVTQLAPTDIYAVTKSDECNMIYIYEAVEECTDHYEYVEYGDNQTELVHDYTSCRYYSELLGRYLQCTTYGGSSGGSGGGSTEGGGSSGDYDPVMKEFSGIYDPSSPMTSTQKEAVYWAFDMLVTRSSVYKTLMEELEKKKIKVRFEVNSEMKDKDAKAQYRGNGTIRFKYDYYINDENLEEEFVHLIQHQLFYGNTISDKESNMEFEAKLFIDVLCLVRSGGCGQKGLGYLPEEEKGKYSDLVYKIGLDRIFTNVELNICKELCGKANYNPIEGEEGEEKTIYNPNKPFQMLIDYFMDNKLNIL